MKIDQEREREQSLERNRSRSLYSRSSLRSRSRLRSILARPFKSTTTDFRIAIIMLYHVPNALAEIDEELALLRILAIGRLEAATLQDLTVLGIVGCMQIGRTRRPLQVVAVHLSGHGHNSPWSHTLATQSSPVRSLKSHPPHTQTRKHSARYRARDRSVTEADIDGALAMTLKVTSDQQY